MSKVLRGVRQAVAPGRVDIDGSFDCFPNAGGAIAGKAYINGATETCANFDSIIEETNLGDHPIALELVDDAVYADALFDCSSDTNRAVAPAHMDTIFGLGGVTAFGAAGNAWEICLVGDAPAAGGVTVHDDAVAGVTYISFEAGVSTAANVEAAVGAYGGELVVDTVDTLGGALTVADDEFGPSLCGQQAGNEGADQETIDVTPGVNRNDPHEVVIHFQSAATTVLNVETLITALAGSDDVIGVQTAGTAVSVLATGAPPGGDEMPRTFLHSGQCPNIRGRDFTATRGAVGRYDITLAANYPGGLVAADADLQVPAIVDDYTVTRGFDITTRVLQVFCCDQTTGAAVDPADGTKMHFTATMDNLG